MMFPKNMGIKNGQTIRVRKAEISDASKILEHVDQVGGETDYLTYGSGESGLTLNDQEKLIDRSIRTGNWLILLAELNGQIVGLLNFRCGTRPRTMHTGIFGVTVLKDYWGLGIGRRLVESLVAWSRTAEIKKINLKVRPDNTRAIDIYRRFGFVEEGRISREYHIQGRYFNNILMGLEID